MVVRSAWNEVECSTLTTIRELTFPEWFLCQRRQASLNFARLCTNVAIVAAGLALLLPNLPTALSVPQPEWSGP